MPVIGLRYEDKLAYNYRPFLSFRKQWNFLSDPCIRMAAFNTSSRHEDMSLRLRAQNMRTAKEQTKKLELESRKMEERLKELKMAMTREKEEREQNGGGFWRTGQSGNLASYATDVLDKHTKTSAKDSKRKPIKVLRDEPLDLPSRSSEPGTMKYIAKTSQKTGKDSRLKGPKCGQCEDRAACLTCVQCSEHYCSGCFAAFHLRGALKKHRSVPLHASGPRQCMSPRPTPPPSYREPVKQSPAVGAVSSSISYQESERNGPEGASGSFESPSLLRGQYNEADSAASFQAALQAWRSGDDPSLTPSPRKSVSPRKSTAAVSVDTGTTMTDKPVSPEIKFSHTISYADRLLLKQHRRTDPGGLDSSIPYDDYPSPRSAGMSDTRGTRRREGTLDLSDENPVNFSALYQASLSNINQAVSDVSRPESSLSIVELKESPPKSRHIDHTDKYQVQEVGSFEAWEVQTYRKSPSSSRSASETDRIMKTPLSRTHSRKSRHQVTVENAVTETQVTDLPQDHQSPITNSLPDSRGKSREKLEDRLKSDAVDGDASLNDQGNKRPKSRPASRKSRQPARPKSGRQSRPNSRAFSRAASAIGEGVLTKTPSSALHEIASRLKETDTQLYSPTLQDFFMAGVKPAPQERTITPSQDKKVMKVSNRLYQMAPRSWRPDSSLGDALPMDQVPMEDTETVISFTYSAQTWGQPDSVTRASSPGEDNPSRSGTPQRSVCSPIPSRSRKSTSQWPSHTSESRSGRQSHSRTDKGDNDRVDTTPTDQPEESGRTSQAIVLDGDDMTQYDDVEMEHNCNEEDEETLNQLEWELASESGRITADGQLSRLSVQDSVSDSGGSSRNSTPVIKLSMDKGFDINMKLRDDELCEDMDENANQKKDEEDVKDLH